MSKKDEKERTAAAKPETRRYVGKRESIWYILYDVSNSFDINRSQEVFVSDFAKIEKRYSAIVTFVVGIWDIINDMILSSVIEKTRTRWGKFKPYLVLYAGPGIILSVAFWTMPLLFSALELNAFMRFVFYFILLIFKNFAESLRAIARDGMLATITPDITDRSRLINIANLMSGFIEKTPEQLFSFMRSLALKGIIRTPMQSLYVGFGTVTVVIGGLIALGFALVAKERVIQSVHKPKLLYSIRMILRCRPVLLITLSDLLGSLSSVSIDSDTYYQNVLCEPLITQIKGIPGAFMTPLSYAYAPALQRRFSTRALWIFSAHFDNFLMIGVYFIGRGHNRFKNKWFMIAVLTAEETLWMSIQALRANIPRELRNEVMDYFEWQHGFRAEAMITTVSQLAAKLCNSVNKSFSNLLLDKAGYDVNAAPGGQPPKVERMIFLLYSLLPNALNLLGMIPKFFYNISPEQKERMFADLLARRAAVAEQAVHSMEA